MIVSWIDLSKIIVQDEITNRDEEEVLDSSSFLKLVSSIRETKGLIQPIVVQEIGGGKFKLYVGFRRYLAYKKLRELDGESYRNISAYIAPHNIAPSEMFLKTIHENSFREDLSLKQKIESRVSLIPFFLNCAKEHDQESNLKIGYSILKEYVSYTRSEKHKTKYFEKIVSITGHSNPIREIGDFFDRIAERPKTFFYSAKIFLEYDEEIKQLFIDGLISKKHARLLEAIKNKKEMYRLIEIIRKNNMTDGEILSLIKGMDIKDEKGNKTSDIEFKTKKPIHEDVAKYIGVSPSTVGHLPKKHREALIYGVWYMQELKNNEGE